MITFQRGLSRLKVQGVYIIYLDTMPVYVGWSSNIGARLSNHAGKLKRGTHPHLPYNFKSGRWAYTYRVSDNPDDEFIESLKYDTLYSTAGVKQHPYGYFVGDKHTFQLNQTCDALGISRANVCRAIDTDKTLKGYTIRTATKTEVQDLYKLNEN